MIRNTNQIAKTGVTVLTPQLVRYFTAAGREAALRMPENVPIARYVRDRINDVVADYEFLDDHGIAELLLAWNTGFSEAIKRRVQDNSRTAMTQAPRGWAVIEADDADADPVPKVQSQSLQPPPEPVTACSNVRPIQHLPRKAKSRVPE